MTKVTEVTDEGITFGTLQDYISHIEDRYRDSDIYGENFRTGPGAVSGFHSSLKAELLSDLAAALAEAAKMGDPRQAVGSFLSEVVAFSAITRNEEQYSSVTVSFTAESAGTTVTALNTQISDGAGSTFIPLVSQVIAPSATEEVPCVAVDPGPIVGAAGTLTTIDKRPYGLASATNLTGATEGRLVESDPALKTRNAQAATVVSNNSSAGIERALRDLDAVTDANIWVGSDKYLKAVVEGATDEDIAKTLHRSVAGGTMYDQSATTTVNYIDEDTGDVDDIKFYRVAEKPIYITFVVQKLKGYEQAGGDALIKSRTVDLFAGELEVEGSSIPRPRIGQNVVGSKVSIGADSVDNCYVREIRIDFAANPLFTDDLSLEFWQRASTSDLLVNIVESA